MRAKTALIVIGIPKTTVELSCLPSSMRFAISISPSRLSSETLPISLRYSRTGSSVRLRSPGVRSIFLSSSSVSPPSSASSVVPSPSDIICWYRSLSGESMISMSISPNMVIRLLSRSDVTISAGRVELRSRYVRKPFSLPMEIRRLTSSVLSSLRIDTANLGHWKRSCTQEALPLLLQRVLAEHERARGLRLPGPLGDHLGRLDFLDLLPDAPELQGLQAVAKRRADIVVRQLAERPSARDAPDLSIVRAVDIGL